MKDLTSIAEPNLLATPNADDLMRRILDEFARSNIFVRRLLDCKLHHEWTDMQFLAQAVVILAEQNNRLQDELMQMHYAKSFPDRLVMDRKLSDEDVELVVNDLAELGVKVRDQFFWLHKGESLVYEDGRHDNGDPMMWRPVGKREFGETCCPSKFYKTGAVIPERYTDKLEFIEGLSDGKPESYVWQQLPRICEGGQK